MVWYINGEVIIFWLCFKYFGVFCYTLLYFGIFLFISVYMVTSLMEDFISGPGKAVSKVDSRVSFEIYKEMPKISLTPHFACFLNIPTTLIHTFSVTCCMLLLTIQIKRVYMFTFESDNSNTVTTFHI